MVLVNIGPEKVVKTGKYLSIFVMLLTGISTVILTLKGYLSTQEYGEVIIALGVFLVALRGYLKDKYGVI